MAHGSTYNYRGSWYYKIDVGHTAEGKRKVAKKGGFHTRRMANTALNKVIAQLSDGTYFDASTDRLDGYLTNRWLPAKKLAVRPKTYDTHEYQVRCNIIPALGGYELGQLNAELIQGVYAELLDGGLSTSTVAGTHRTFRAAMRQAVVWHKLRTDPTKGVLVPSEDKGSRVEYWSPGQLDTFLDGSAHHELCPLFHLLAWTGLRVGEALGLQWPDIDLDAKTLSVSRTLVYSTSAGGMYLGDPKTASSSRRIDLDATTAAALRRWRKHQIEQQLAAGPDWANDTDTVFTKPDGSWWRYSSAYGIFVRLIAHLDLPQIRVHDLRHTHATMLLADGAHPKVVQERLGHASITETMDTYSHVMPSLQRDAIDSLAARFGS